ncbi:hypothetical protein Pint_29229 [Pistacia integerrima]|uniref:Uncharacterized protein n=1 Tax=Pistacia integerrima TaxID=434235 RepID=A0ACC0WZC5_9ROSI|nr:hypothetical protein Pint_29229 [Pistacia integerrima]
MEEHRLRCNLLVKGGCQLIVMAFDTDVGLDSIHLGSQPLKACKIENDALADSGETTFALFASLLDSALQGLMPIQDLILSLKDHAGMYLNRLALQVWVQHTVEGCEDKLMKQKAQLLLDEAASWSLLWYLYGKGTEEPPEDHILLPSTSHIEAYQFVVNDHTAQLCLWIVQWLEGLASKALDLESKVRGPHVGTYLPISGIWHHTQRFLKKGASSSNTFHHLDFDAPTRERAHQLIDDKVALTVLCLQKLDESLLEDVWTLLRAGRLEDACDLCRSAGQLWRAATLCPFGGMDLFPSVEALVKNGKNRTLQAIELESGTGHQWQYFEMDQRNFPPFVLKKISEQDGGKYETAVNAAQCSNLKHMLPICTDWEV